MNLIFHFASFLANDPWPAPVSLAFVYGHQIKDPIA